MDVRDNKRIATLPPDLRDIANEMLEKKFGLAKQGEVVEKKKAKEKSVHGHVGIDGVNWGYSSTTYKSSIFDDVTTTSNDPGGILTNRSIEDVVNWTGETQARYRAAWDLAMNPSISINHWRGLTLEEWLPYLDDAYKPDMKAYKIDFIGQDTGERYHQTVPVTIFANSYLAPREVLQGVRDALKSQMREPVWFLKPE